MSNAHCLQRVSGGRHKREGKPDEAREASKLLDEQPMTRMLTAISNLADGLSPTLEQANVSEQLRILSP